MTTTYPFTEDGLRAALDALGSTADEVADTLRRGGHVGIPGDCDFCPIARYLAAALPDAQGVRVFRDEAIAWRGLSSTYLNPTLNADECLTARTPYACRQFVANFDRVRDVLTDAAPTAYPDLIEETS